MTSNLKNLTAWIGKVASFRKKFGQQFSYLVLPICGMNSIDSSPSEAYAEITESAISYAPKKEHQTGRLKLLFFTASLGNGGAEMHLLRLINALDRRQFRPSVALAQLGGSYESALAKDVPLFGLNPPGISSSTLHMARATYHPPPSPLGPEPFCPSPTTFAVC